jgi:hypothetical protein
MSAIRVLLRNSIDYAGLFPPAGLEMRAAVANYAQYLTSDAVWALGRFILPASRLEEFEVAAQRHLSRSPSGQPWRLSVLTGSDLSADLDRIAAFNHRHAEAAEGAAVIDALEAKASSVAAIQDTMRLTPSPLQVYIEIPIGDDPTSLIAVMSRTGGRAKVRTGGITSEAFPPTEEVLRFLQSCNRARVPFKATAGLHHPLRAEYRLTYASDSPRGTMFGFLNLFLAAAFLHAGKEEDVSALVLEETSPEAFRWDKRAVSWRGHRLGQDELRAARQNAIIAFGSCSFTEPVEELEALGLLEPRVSPA